MEKAKGYKLLTLQLPFRSPICQILFVLTCLLPANALLSLDMRDLSI